MDRQSEKRLAEELKQGSTEALGEIIDGLSGYVCTVVRNFSRGTLSEDEVDELSSDIFFKLWQNRANIDAECGLRPYLSACARNAVKNRFRKMPPEQIDSDISELDIPDGFSLEDQAELNEIMRCLDEEMKKLSEKSREIFTRFYFFGERTPEIARIMGLSESAVRSTLSKTRSRLKDYLMKRGFDNYV